MICHFHIIFIFFTLFSYVYHIFELGAQIWGPKNIFLSYSWSCYFHIFGYSPSNTKFWNSNFDGLLEVRSYEISISNDDRQKLASHDFEFDFECPEAKVSWDFEFEWAAWLISCVENGKGGGGHVNKIKQIRTNPNNFWVILINFDNLGAFWKLACSKNPGRHSFAGEKSQR